MAFRRNIEINILKIVVYSFYSANRTMDSYSKLFSDEEIISQLHDITCNEVILFGIKIYNLSQEISYHKFIDKYAYIIEINDTNPTIAIFDTIELNKHGYFKLFCNGEPIRVLCMSSDLHNVLKIMYENNCTHPIINDWLFAGTLK